MKRRRRVSRKEKTRATDEEDKKYARFLKKELKETKEEQILNQICVETDIEHKLQIKKR